MEILGVRVDNFSREEILEKVEFFLTEEKFHRIATINPEFILEAQKNSEFRNILNSCDLNVADGFGVKLAFWKNGRMLKSRFPGIDLMLEILKIANDQNLSIFLAANKDGLSTWQETRNAILKIHPNLNITGDDVDIKNGSYKLPPEADPPLAEKAISYKLVFCNFGAPQQELFIDRIKNDTIRLAMGVGGSFDFLTGKAKRAPAFVRRFGLEWLWRLLRQPKRWRRIWNAVGVFTVKNFINK